MRGPSHLPEFLSVGVGTNGYRRMLLASRLPRFHGADPSTSLDKRAIWGFQLLIAPFISYEKMTVKPTFVDVTVSKVHRKAGAKKGEFQS